MLLANYGSDSESGSDNESSGPSRPAPPPRKPVVAPAAAKPKRKGPIKITLDLPKASGSDNDDDDDGAEKAKGKGKGKATPEAPPAKRPKLAGGAGGSSLLGMLPPPKRKLPTAATKPGLAVNRSMAAKPALPKPAAASAAAADDDDDDDDDEARGKTGLMMPATLKRSAMKGRAKEAELDLFGLSEAAPAKPKLSVAEPTLKPPTVSAAPAIAEFQPPDPTPTDPYPGYYQLPSGSWAAYDQAVYSRFAAQWTGPDAASEERRAREEGRLGREWAEFNNGRANVIDIGATDGMAEMRAAEARKAQTIKPRLAGDDFEYQTKGLANERHQLTSLLHTAYSNREELEERIQQNKKNMRLASQKYGF